MKIVLTCLQASLATIPEWVLIVSTVLWAIAYATALLLPSEPRRDRLFFRLLLVSLVQLLFLILLPMSAIPLQGWTPETPFTQDTLPEELRRIGVILQLLMQYTPLFFGLHAVLVSRAMSRDSAMRQDAALKKEGTDGTANAR